MAKNAQSEHKYQIVYLFTGLISMFIGLVALFEWGFAGMMVMNCLRLLLGQAYDLVLVGGVGLGLYMVVRGRHPQWSGQVIAGCLLILIALTSFLHLYEAGNIVSSQDSVFVALYDRFKNELLMGQHQTSLGGGFLGAVFAVNLTYLFGRIGTQLLMAALLLIGLILAAKLDLDDLHGGFDQIARLIRRLFAKLDRGLDEAKEVFHDDNKEYVPAVVRKQAQRRPSRQENMGGFFSQLKAKTWGRFETQFFEDDVQDSAERWEHHTPESAVPPASSLHNDGPMSWESGDAPLETQITNDPSQQTSAAEPVKVLDLDYFDQSFTEGTYAKIDQQQLLDSKNQVKTKSEAVETVADWVQDEPPARPIISMEQDEDLSEVTEAQLSSGQNQAEQESLEDQASQPAVPPREGLSAGHWQANAEDTELLTAADDQPAVTSKEAKSVKAPKKGPYRLPGVDLLNQVEAVDQSEEYERINENIDKLEQTFDSFGVKARVIKANLGPSVTKYEIEPAVGVKVSKIVSLADDIALALAARDVRMEAPIPGKSYIGIEVPNTQVSPVSFREVVGPALKSKELLDVPLGRDVSGKVCLADLSKMPHLLIAGATGSGKSVGMNVIICSLLMKAHPDEVKFLMVDPKKVELMLYNDIPHLLAPVVTNPRKAAQALNRVVQEMERRYELFAATGTRNIDGYNELVDDYQKNHGEVHERLPRIIVLVDELADLMMVAGNEVETAIIRLAQMARAAGIHMIIATQRPSVDVITGIIKANVPSRLAFAVSSGTDSRTILDSVGAERLLGRGDMLFQPMGRNKPIRVQGAYISDQEVERITNYIKAQREAEYDESMIITESSMLEAEASEDEYFQDAVNLIKDQETISISQLQRHFRIGYNRAARLIDDLEALGYVSPQDGSKPRQVLIQDSE